jgi:hypothetical protein
MNELYGEMFEDNDEAGYCSERERERERRGLDWSKQ